MTVKYNNHTTVDIRKHKIRTIVDFSNWDIKKLEETPTDLGESILEMICYNHSETVTVKAYNNYMTIVDDTTGEKVCLYSKEMDLAQIFWDYYISVH